MPFLGHSWSGKGAKVVSLVVFGAVPTRSTKSDGIEVYISYFIMLGPTLASFRLFWSHWANFFTMNTWKKGPTGSSGTPPVVFKPGSTPSNPKYALWTDLSGQKAIFSFFGPFLGPLWAALGTFWVWQIDKMVNLNALSAVPNLFQHCSIK